MPHGALVIDELRRSPQIGLPIKASIDRNRRPARIIPTGFSKFHFRDRHGRDVDVVAEFFDGTVIGIEVKSGSTLKAEHFKGLAFLRERFGDRFLGGSSLDFTLLTSLSALLR